MHPRGQRGHKPTSLLLTSLVLMLVACSAPTPAPTATPTPIPTGSWVTWEEIQQRTLLQYGIGPTIALNGRNVDGSSLRAWLYVECQWLDSPGVPMLSVMWTNYWREPTLPDEEPPSPQVSYAIDGEWSTVSAWEPTEYDARYDGAYARQTQTDDIIRALLEGASVLEVKVEGDASLHYRFRTQGFSKAYEPVRARCG